MAKVKDIFIKESQGCRVCAFEYCAQWGSTKNDGDLFYKASTEADDWTKEDWATLSIAIDKKILSVKADPQLYDDDDVAALEKLKSWAAQNGRRI